MRLSSLLIPTLTFAAAAGISLVAASFAVTAVEQNSETNLRRALDDRDMGWAEVTSDGLRVRLQGTAPDEATRFAALSLAGGIVDASRVIDEMSVPPSKGIAPPRFSAEILRNHSGISIIGLIPTSSSRADLVKQLNGLREAGQVADLLETAEYPVPKGWEAALRYAIAALELLPRAKISVDAERIKITTMAESAAAKDILRDQLTRLAPPELHLVLDITAARPVITPFTLRFLIDEGGAHFDACSAESAESRAYILNAARAAGLEGRADCVIGMGVPSPNWSRASALSIASLAALGQGTVTIANADITLVAAEATPPALFDKVVGELENALPEVFALHAVLPTPSSDASAGPPEFTATLSPEGQVQLRGRINDEISRDIASSYAQARFGSDAVHTATRVVTDLPRDWPVRVLAGLEALSHLERGAVTVTPDNLQLRGMSHREDTLAVVSGFLAEKLGEAESYELALTYEEPPIPEDQPLPAELCAAQLAGAQASSGKIGFEPGSATVAAGSSVVLDHISTILERCGPVRLEIQGHTDSQGREGMNQTLSQARAQSILNELRARRIRTSAYVASGYGESRPIASNDTEEGREANRRIEFRLILPETNAEGETTLEGAAATAATEDQADTDDAQDPPADQDSNTTSNTEQETSGQ
ncbi:OmpA family protein [Pseudophaeobacter flagellatus]|uniref:OmpA family protein n=1 Tax=Pseudophaeobacter flagellatus TaxID=2899119 RepID=UPI001E462891|nr:OmpA family protein [Pseudophaeobacter flagellatus]MCD9148167.1 OmpA family protein [Pseudophaeobacter flagellatus]